MLFDSINEWRCPAANAYATTFRIFQRLAYIFLYFYDCYHKYPCSHLLHRLYEGVSKALFGQVLLHAVASLYRVYGRSGTCKKQHPVYGFLGAHVHCFIFFGYF